MRDVQKKIFIHEASRCRLAHAQQWSFDFENLNKKIAAIIGKIDLIMLYK